MDAPSGMQLLLSDLVRFFGHVFSSWIPQVANTIVNNPILLLTVGFLVVGGAIGIFGRLLSKR